MWGNQGVESRVVGRGRRLMAGNMGQLTCGMGLEWRIVHIIAQKATIPCKGFYSLKAHTFIPYTVLYNIILLLYIFLLYR
jgi:hypothetical protein